MNMYLDAKRIAFLILSLLSFLFIMICTFSKGWTTHNGVNFGLFSPDISTNNVCGLVLKNDSKCLVWFRGTQALMVLAVLSNIVTVIGIILVETRNMRFVVAGAGQFAVGVLAVLALVVYSFKSGYMTGIPAYDLGWAFKLSWVVCLFSIIGAVIGLTDGTKGGGMNL